MRINNSLTKKKKELEKKKKPEVMLGSSKQSPEQLSPPPYQILYDRPAIRAAIKAQGLSVVVEAAAADITSGIKKNQ